MWIWIVLGVVALIVLFGIIVMTRPSAFRIERSAQMAAPRATVFDQVNDFQKWRSWSPWEKIDPNLQRDYGGPPAGVGTTYHWVGNKKVGEGRMTIVESKPAESVRIRLEFLKPFVAINTATFTFKPQGDKTNVTWAMDGKNDNFMMKAFCMFMNMDEMVGKDFEKGLASMKTVAESAAKG
jgi:hypothetical protein